jgi:hypothetical protein
LLALVVVPIVNNHQKGDTLRKMDMGPFDLVILVFDDQHNR